jgi:hypothetical protein
MVAFIETARKVLVLVIVTKIIGICFGPSHWTGDGGCVSHEDVDAIVKMPKKVFSGLLTKQQAILLTNFPVKSPASLVNFTREKKAFFRRGGDSGGCSRGEAAGARRQGARVPGIR